MVKRGREEERKKRILIKKCSLVELFCGNFKKSVLGELNMDDSLIDQSRKENMAVRIRF